MATNNAVNNTSLVTTFVASGTWTPNQRTQHIQMYLWQGGGGGGSGACGTSYNGGSGGGAGWFCAYELLGSNLQSTSYTVTVGAGATGGASVTGTSLNGNNGAVGGVTSVGVIGGIYQYNVGAVNTNAGAQGTNASNIFPGASSAFSVSNSIYGSSNIAGYGKIMSSLIQNATGIPYAYGTGGGGGSGHTASTAIVGGSGATIYEGDGTTVLVAGGLAGANTGANAGNGNAPPAFELFIGGTGGGGGGNNGLTVAGSGGNGAVPSGGGGGGSANANLSASGAGGNGAAGQVIIVEFY